jgi:hypothetical protein
MINYLVLRILWHGYQSPGKADLHDLETGFLVHDEGERTVKSVMYKHDLRCGLRGRRG